jgi:hypothetical protein
MPPCAASPSRPVAQPDPLALIGPRPGPAAISDATCWTLAARLPARRAADELGLPTCRDEPAVLTGRMGGTDEFLGRRGLIASAVSDGKPSRRLTPLMCLAPLRADASAWNVAGAADAKESTAIRETCELKEEIFRIPRCAYRQRRP